MEDYGDKIVGEVSTYIKALEAQSESLRNHNSTLRDENKRLFKKTEQMFDENCRLITENQLRHKLNVDRGHEREENIFLDNIPWDNSWVGTMVNDNIQLTAKVKKLEKEAEPYYKGVLSELTAREALCKKVRQEERNQVLAEVRDKLKHGHLRMELARRLTTIQDTECDAYPKSFVDNMLNQLGV